MQNITKPIIISMPVTPYDLAVIFCEMAANEQASFFHLIHDEVMTLGDVAGGFIEQIAVVSECASPEARQVMRMLGEAANGKEFN